MEEFSVKQLLDLENLPGAETGEEMVVYESLEDAVEKCNFYLSNQELRGKIARKGRERVLTEHNMVDKIRYMMDVAEV